MRVKWFLCKLSAYFESEVESLQVENVALPSKFPQSVNNSLVHED